VVELHDRAEGTVDVDGRLRRVSLVALVLDGAAPAPGDWLLLHTGFAIETLAEAEALELVALARDVRARDLKEGGSS